MSDVLSDLSKRASQLVRSEDARRITALLDQLDQRLRDAEQHSGIGEALRTLVQSTGRLGRFANPAARLFERVVQQLTREQRAFNEATVEALRVMRQIVAIKGAEQIADRVDSAVEGLWERFAEETDRLRVLERGMLAQRDGVAAIAPSKSPVPTKRRS